MNQSTGCSVGSDDGPGGRSHETLTWAEKCRSPASIQFSNLPPSSKPSFVFSFHKLASFCPLRKLTLTSMKSCGCSLS